jgi:hypothetical protein
VTGDEAFAWALLVACERAKADWPGDAISAYLNVEDVPPDVARLIHSAHHVGWDNAFDCVIRGLRVQVAKIDGAG